MFGLKYPHGVIALQKCVTISRSAMQQYMQQTELYLYCCTEVISHTPRRLQVVEGSGHAGNSSKTPPILNARKGKQRPSSAANQPGRTESEQHYISLASLSKCEDQYRYGLTP